MLLFDTIEKVSPWQDWLENLSVIQAGNKDLLQLQEAINSTHTVGIDLETNGLDPYLSDICLIQIAAGNIKNPSDTAECFLFQPSKPVLAYLVNLIENPNITKIFCNAKFDLKMLQAKCDRRLTPKNIYDVMLASQIVTAGDFIPEHQFEKYCRENGIVSVKQGSVKYYDSHGHEVKFTKDTAKSTRPVYVSHSLQQIAHRYLEVWMNKELQVSDWSQPLMEDQIQYAAWDAAILLPLYNILQELIIRNKLENTIQIEMNCLSAVIEIEMSGMPFKREQAEKLLAETEVDLAEAVKKLELANPNSSGQVADKIAHLGKEFLRGNELVIQGETFELSSGDEILSRMKARLPEDHPLSVFIQNIQQYRHLKKKADMLKKWLESVHPNTGRLHPDLVQINPQGVGRFSAREPNLQQVGRDKALRELFAAPPGRKLVICDYSGIEMRIMAELSKDKTLIKAFKDGIDIHKFTASRISGKPLDDVTKEERQASKACFSADTEILTGRGWVRFDEYNGETPVAQFSLEGFEYNPPRSPGNRWTGSRKRKCLGIGKINFVRPLAFRSFEGRELFHYADRNVDLLVTPDHEVIWIDSNGRPRKLRADETNSGNVRYFIAAGFYRRENFTLNEAETRALAMAVADGSFKHQKGCLCFGFSKPRKINRCRSLLKACGVEFKEVVYSNGNYGKATHIMVNDKGFIGKLLQYVSEDKDLKVEAAFDLNQLWYLDEAKHWDGCVVYKGKRGERVVFSTTRRQTADVMQVMAAVAGVPSVLRTHEDPRRLDYKTYTLSYLLPFSPYPLWRQGGKQKGKLFEAVPGEHRVYCVQVPSGAIVVRRNGKVVVCGNCNFGLIYGMQASALQEYAETGYGVAMTKDEARKSREAFFRTYPGIERWHRKQNRLMTEKGFADYWTYRFGEGFVREKRPAVRTLGGRMRVWPTENGKSGLKKVGPVTELYNTPDQGTGADMIKLAMNYVYKELTKPEWKDTMLIACIHDELILETPAEKAEQAKKMLLEQMLKAAGKLLPHVPVEAEAEIADSWAEK